jgi:urea transport system ATP-binding protein
VHKLVKHTHSATSALVVKDLKVAFDKFVAVNGISFSVEPGDLRFLIGPNGAGKTTVIDAITGLVPAKGSVTIGEVELLGKKVHKVTRLGVGRTFQTASIFEKLTVQQNLDIACGIHRSPLALFRKRKFIDPRVQDALSVIGLGALSNVKAGTLAHGQKQWLEIGMLLVQDAHVLLLDEPVAGMSQDEREETGKLLQRIGKDRIVLVVEHDMDFMRSFANSATVMVRGSILTEGSVQEVQSDPRVQEVYLGPKSSEVK